MITLGIETSSVVASIAIINDKEILGEMSINHPNTHSQKLMPLINNLFEQLDLKIKDIDLIAVANGPGSFTGIRIGITTAKALAHKDNIPLVAISTLDSLANNLINYTGKVISIIDARRKKVFVKEFNVSNREIIIQKEAQMLIIDEYIEKINKYDVEIMLVGSGVSENLDIITNKKNNNIQIASKCFNLPDAKSLCIIAEKINKIEYLTYNEVKANYIRLSQAEISKKNK